MSDTILRAILGVGGCLLLVWLFERFINRIGSKRHDDQPNS